jgi:hypothetical protein
MLNRSSSAFRGSRRRMFIKRETVARAVSGITFMAKRPISLITDSIECMRFGFTTTRGGNSETWANDAEAKISMPFWPRALRMPHTVCTRVSQIVLPGQRIRDYKSDNSK